MKFIHILLIVLSLVFTVNAGKIETDTIVTKKERADSIYSRAVTTLAFTANKLAGDSLRLSKYAAVDSVHARSIKSSGKITGDSITSRKLVGFANDYAQLILNNNATGGRPWYVGSTGGSWSAGNGKFVIGSMNWFNGTTSEAFLCIDSTGKMGLGMVYPTQRLQVKGSVVIDTNLTVSKTAGADSIYSRTAKLSGKVIASTGVIDSLYAANAILYM